MPVSPNIGSQNAAIGDEGELWFAARLPRGWVWQPPRRDLGKDGLIVVRDDSDLHNLEFSIQVKSSVRSRLSGEWVVISNVSRSSVLYWFASPLPTLVVAIDISKQCAWYAWHLDLFDSPKALFKEKAKELAIRIPQRNTLDEVAWNSIREGLRLHFRSLQEALHQAGSHVRIVASVNLIATALRNLVKLAEIPVPGNTPTEKEGISVLLEQVQHRDILSVARKILDQIHPESVIRKQVLFWIESYESTARTAFPLISDLPAENHFGPDLNIAFAPRAVHNARRDLIDAGFDLIALLTKIRPSAEMDAGA